MSLSTIWKRLQEINTLELDAAENFRSQNNQPAWSGRARGQVFVSAPDKETLIFDETGEWDFTEKPKIKFFNIYRWRKAENEILELSHLRQGVDSPVHLLNFKQVSEIFWRSESPHVCREDLYSADLSLEENAIRLSWTIDGPAKKQKVECIYK